MVSMFGHTMEDGLLTMSLALAFASFQKGVVTGRTLPFVFAGLWIAVGFQAKMLQAWFIVPALVIAIVVTTAPPRVRLLRAFLLGAVTVAASLSWMGIVQFVPAADRPFFDGSVSNDVFASVFGYNGLDRFVPGIVPGAAPAFSASVIAPGADGRSPFKLLLPAFTTQVGWFYPLALLGLVTAAVRLRSGAAPPSLRAVDTEAASAPLVIGLGGWLVTAAAVLTVAPVPHTAYLAAVTVPVSLLAAIAVGDAVMAARRGRPASLLVVIAAETLWTVGILVGTGLSPAWLLAFVSVCGAAALVLAGSTRAGPSTLASVAAGLAMLAAPGVWTVSTVDPALAGTANDAYAGPRVGTVPYFFQTDAPESERRSFSRFALLPPDLSQPGPQLTDEQRNLADFVRRSPGHDGAPLFTTSTWQDAEPYILAGGLNVRALGGYSGAVPSPTLASIRRGVRQQATSYFLFPARSPTGRIPDTESQRIVAWVTGRCSYVPDDVYEGATTLPGQSLWACTRGT
ncbi:membrane protein [Frondihabitans sucicola]|uniref:Membrane protein n=2 Tax=Frondihabitans sucicola TaxID=1268041 RepID=A0ABN6Y791_9MICO|nr:membrane protein [Frondihabitans sucicola]